MSLLTPDVRAKLIANGKSHGFASHEQVNNVPPVCFIYYEGSDMCWLLTEIDATKPNLVWGIVDLGDGRPDYQSFTLDVIEKNHRPEALDEPIPTPTVQMLDGFQAKGPLSLYIAAARAGRIVDLDGTPMPRRPRRDVRAIVDYSDADVDAFLSATPAKMPFLGLTRFILRSQMRRLFGLTH